MTTHTVGANSPNGWVFDADDETWIVDPGVTVSSQTDSAFKNVGLSDDTLVNLGTVSSADLLEAAVRFDTLSGSATVFNAPSGVISGARNGASFFGSGDEELINFGKIFGQDNNGVFFSNSALNVFVENHGYIFGASFGVENASHNIGGAILNFGIIRAGAAPPKDGPYPPAAISLFTEPLLVTNIVNAKGATIKGAVDAIYANAGEFTLVNHGTIIGNIVDGDGGSDLITNTGKIKGNVYLAGNSVYNGAGGSSGAIHVGGGDATVTGGKGVDHFVFDSAITTQVTTITNFRHAIDKIVLSEADFSALGHDAIGHVLALTDFHIGTGAQTPSQHIVYDRAHGILYYDPSGSGGSQIEIATFTNDPPMANTDILIRA
jgi:hypothetical protein